MLKYFSDATLYVLSSLVFTAARQLLFFPFLFRADIEAFEILAFLVLLSDLLVYPFAGTLGDYYQKRLAGNDSDGNVALGLAKVSIFGLVTSFVFFIFTASIISSIVASLFIVFYILNSILIKRLYNCGELKKCLLYNIIRSLAFLLLTVSLYVFGVFGGLYLFLMLAVFELVCVFFLVGGIRAFSNVVFASLRKVFPNRAAYSALAYLFLVTCLGALWHRSETLFVKFFWPESLTDFLLLVNVVNFVCTPLVLLVSNPMMSFLVAEKVQLNKTTKIYSVVSSVVISIFIFIFLVLTYPFITSVVYGVEYQGQWRVLSGILGVFIFSYFFYRVMAVKYLEEIVLVFSGLVAVFLVAVFCFLSSSITMFLLVFGICKVLSVAMPFLMSNHLAER